MAIVAAAGEPGLSTRVGFAAAARLRCEDQDGPDNEASPTSAETIMARVRTLQLPLPKSMLRKLRNLVLMHLLESPLLLRKFTPT